MFLLNSDSACHILVLEYDFASPTYMGFVGLRGFDQKKKQRIINAKMYVCMYSNV